MTPKSRKQFDRQKRLRQLKRTGWDVEPVRTVVPHHGPEMVQHFLVKALVGYVMEKRGRTWVTEIEHDERGRVDMLDWGPSDWYLAIYEIESGCSSERKPEKVGQYCGPLVQYVLVVSLADVSNEVPGVRERISQRVRRCMRSRRNGFRAAIVHCFRLHSLRAVPR